MTGSGVTDRRRQDWFRTSQEKKSSRTMLSALSVRTSRAALYRVGKSETSASRPPVRRSYRDGILPGEDYRPLSSSVILVAREFRIRAAMTSQIFLEPFSLGYSDGTLFFWFLYPITRSRKFGQSKI